MKFKYKKFLQRDFSTTIRPIIPVTLSHGEKALEHEVLIDSGADMCLFDAAIGEYLGLDVESGEEAVLAGVTGGGELFYWHTVILRVGIRDLKTRVGFTRDIASSYGIAGQKGFFDAFVVTFDYKKQEIELKERK